MTSDIPTSKSRLLDRLEALVEERFPGQRSDMAARFVRRYYARLRSDLLETCALLDLYGAALAQLSFMRQRRKDQTLVRVYNPTLEQDGWECPHSVVEIIVEDMPFLVDSVRMTVNRRGLDVLRIIHPLMTVRRDTRGQLIEILDRHQQATDAKDPETHRESVIHLEILRQTDRARLADLEIELTRVLQDICWSVEDWPPMRSALVALVAELEIQPPPLDIEDRQETTAFLRWLESDHFAFLGYRRYDLAGEQGDEALHVVPGSGLGILRDRNQAEESQTFASLPPQLRAHARQPDLLLLTKASARATVHRPANLDYIGVKRFDANGKVIGEHRFLGLYGSRAYNHPPQEIPVLRRKIRYVTEQADLEPDSHSAKALAHILESYPRDELFQISEEDLFRITTGIMELAEEPRTRLFLREDLYSRFISCLVYTPRERYDTEVRKRMQAILREALNGAEVEFSVSLSESMLARILFTVRTRPGEIPVYDPREIEARMSDAILSWKDHLQAALLEHLGEERGSALFEVYGAAFPAGYREDFPARTAVRDIEHMERMDARNELRMSLYSPPGSPPERLRFKVFRYGRTLPLSQVLPMLENMGVQVEEERPYRIERHDAALWVHDFGLACDAGATPDRADVRELFQDAFAMVWQRRVEDDGFNRLVIKARLDWRQIALIRAYAKYLRQTGMTFSQSYMEQAAAANPAIIAILVQLFESRFNPRRQPNAAQHSTRLVIRLQEALDEVASLDHDRILRAFLAVVRATVRTNWFQRRADGSPKEQIAMKLRSTELPDLPLPRPAFEVFVYSPRMEGIHLRGGKVARGGLRWSDRREDFRTEVLGLMKAQMVKNAVIVPVGAKGGFVVKRPPAEQDALRVEVVACYRQFVAGLLDLTDNLVDGGCLPPPDLIRYDDDDPYLVVAADKGTATFSDTANEIAAGYGFWLGDAFASGGATGYDHKQMGITARGAWECVRQHFLAAEIRYDQKPFTVIGIGDMSGDVFGNGMLLSDKIQLVAAFDHRHIFIDPTPDPITSLQERQRLFGIPRSSWADYDPELISDGGGVYPRHRKSVPLSAAARAVLGTSAEALTPADLIRVLLRAPVDLLWNGGIGTYVRATGERDAEVGDRGNDAVRIIAADLRCRVIGEGGNLGLTQLARIEYARRGGRLDTDFIHNAGGVSCSDHEVNIKILLDRVVADSDLTLKQRNQLLREMTDEVARLVLQDCYWQGRCIGLDEIRARELLAEHSRFIRALEQKGELNPALEYLPDAEALAQRQAAGEGLTRPEIALLVSYAKHSLYQELLRSDLPEDPCLAEELKHYFPKPLQGRFTTGIESHRLRREIVAGAVANRLINRTGSTFVFRLHEDLEVDAAAAVRAYLVAWEVFGLRRLWSTVAVLDTLVPDVMQRQMLSSAARLVARSSRWLLKNRGARIEVSMLIERYRPRIEGLVGQLPELLDEDHRKSLEATTRPLRDAGVPADLALWVACFDTLSRAFDLVDAAEACAVEITQAAQVYFALGTVLGLDWLARHITALPNQERWISGARAAFRDDLLEHHRSLCVAVLTDGMPAASATAKLATWQGQNHGAVDIWLGLLADIKSHDEPDLAMLSVALRALHKLALSTAVRQG